jgi:hypothetical protein
MLILELRNALTVLRLFTLRPLGWVAVWWCVLWFWFHGAGCRCDIPIAQPIHLFSRLPTFQSCFPTTPHLSQQIAARSTMLTFASSLSAE